MSNTMKKDKKENRRTIVSSVSFQPEIYNFVNNLPNKSRYIHEAIIEKRSRETTTDGKIRAKREKARELAKELNTIKLEIKDLTEVE